MARGEDQRQEHPAGDESECEPGHHAGIGRLEGANVQEHAGLSDDEHESRRHHDRHQREQCERDPVRVRLRQHEPGGEQHDQSPARSPTATDVTEPRSMIVTPASNAASSRRRATATKLWPGTSAKNATRWSTATSIRRSRRCQDRKALMTLHDQDMTATECPRFCARVPVRSTGDGRPIRRR